MYTIQDAISDLNDIQFCDNTWQEADAARLEAVKIIERLNAQQGGVALALRELVTAADPATNMSDIVLRDALARAREVLQ